MEKKITIYWAAPCFTQAELIWNRLCATCLRLKGYPVILPQDEIKRFAVNGKVEDGDAFPEHCRNQVISSDVVVDVLDGADTDSGASMEAGFKIQHMRTGGKGIVVGVRTDFRVSEDGNENLMFRLLTDRIFFPYSESYQELCDEIDRRIKKLLQEARQRD